MAEDKVEARELSWRQLLPWTEIFRGFGVAFDLNKLLLAAAGILLTFLGWWLLAVMFGSTFTSSPPLYPGPYASLAANSNESPWALFKRDRDRWNLMHETAGVGSADQRYEVEDIADTAEEYERVHAALGAGPSYDLTKLNEIQPPLDTARINLYKSRLGKPKPDGRLARSPWSEDRGPNPYLLVTGQAGVPWEPGHAVDWLARDQFPVLMEPLLKLMRPMIYFLSPRASGVWVKLYFLLVFLWTVLVWSFFGGAITRIAVVQVARPGEPIGLTDAVRFTYKRWLSYVAAPVFPLVVVFFLLIVSFIFSLFHLVPALGDVFVDGLLWFVMLIIGLMMSLALVGLAVGWPLMAPTISAEGTDSWEALSRSFSYVFQRPWHYLWYAAVTLAYGAVVIFFVGFMGSLTVYLSKWAIAQTTLVASREPSYLFIYAPESFGWRNLLLQGAADNNSKDAEAEKTDPPTNASLVEGGRLNEKAYDHYVRNLHGWNKLGAALVAFWLGLLFLLILGFGYSFFFTTTTIIYLLMRRNLDAAEIDEVYLEEEDQDGFGGSVAPQAPEPAKSSQALQMLEPPSLRPVTPPAPPAPPPVAPAIIPPTAAPPSPPVGNLADTAVLPPAEPKPIAPSQPVPATEETEKSNPPPV
jgi:hypothetical protein